MAAQSREGARKPEREGIEEGGREKGGFPQAPSGFAKGFLGIS